MAEHRGITDRSDLLVNVFGVAVTEALVECADLIPESVKNLLTVVITVTAAL